MIFQISVKDSPKVNFGIPFIQVLKMRLACFVDWHMDRIFVLIGQGKKTIAVWHS